MKPTIRSCCGEISNEKLKTTSLSVWEKVFFFLSRAIFFCLPAAVDVNKINIHLLNKSVEKFSEEFSGIYQKFFYCMFSLLVFLFWTFWFVCFWRLLEIYKLHFRFQKQEKVINIFSVFFSVATTNTFDGSLNWVGNDEGDICFHNNTI